MITQDDTSTRAEPRDPFLGRTFDGYRIDEMIGKGGMGVVYRATQLSLDRPVAIKLLPETVSEHPQFIQRFEREVDVLSKLAHPAIVTVFERGEVDGRPYLVMEYVAGTSLRAVLKQGPLPAPEALVIVRSVLSALEHAHDKGIIHRDIKPENILVAPGGIVKVADFGLGRVLGGAVDTTRLTHTHLLLGTFEYMSPEQREKSKEADARTDLYATGVILYELIAGELPIGHFAPLSLKRPQECDSRMDGVIRRSLQKEPDERYQRASEMGADVSQLLSTPPVPELGARVTRAATVIEEGVIETPPAAGTTVEDGAIETPRPLPAPTEHTRGRAPWWLVLAPAAVVGMFVLPKFANSGTSLGIAPILGVITAMVLGGFVIWRWGGSRAARAAASHTRAANRPNWVFGLAVTALWVLIVLFATEGLTEYVEFRDIVLLALGAIASVFLFANLKARPAIDAEPHGRAQDDRRHDFLVGFSVTALWVGIVLIASKGAGGWRDEEIMWFGIAAVASVFLIPKLKHLAKASGFLLITFGVLVVPIGLFWSATAGGLASYSSSSSIGHMSRPIAPDYAQARKLVATVMSDLEVRIWLIENGFQEEKYLDECEVVLNDMRVHLNLSGDRFEFDEFRKLACAAVAKVLEAATDGRIRPSVHLRKMLPNAPPPPVEKFKRMLPELPE